MAYFIDLNADMGEMIGGNDGAIFQYISSANIACGMHAGDPSVMAETVACAKKAGVAVGAHPGFPDPEGFGRRAMALTPAEIKNYIIYQIGALQAIATAEGIALTHVKPHGALYNMAAQDFKLSAAIAEGIAAVDKELIFVGLSGSEMIRAGKTLGLKVANEVFADRGYAMDGTLIPRTQPGAMITDPAEAARRVLRMVQTGAVRTPGGTDVPLQADTVCLHGDAPAAVETARLIRQELQRAGITIAPLISCLKSASASLQAGSD